MGIIILGLVASLLAIVVLSAFMNWRLAIICLLLFIPFAGLVASWIPHPAAVLAKDLVFVLPAYLSFLVLEGRSTSAVRPTTFFTCSVFALVFVAIVHMANPNLHSVAVGLVGLKVWLFYIPLFLLGGAFVRDQHDLRLLLRVIVVLAPVPCLIGLGQWVASTFLGYQYVMTSIYGELAVANNPAFSSFQYGDGFYIYRIASTFSFSTQYFGYALSMILVSWIASRFETSVRWRNYARASFYIAVTAALLSGSRQAFVFVPAVLFLLMILYRDGKPLMILLAAMAVVVAIPLASIVIPLHSIATHTSELFSHYSNTVFFAGLADAYAKFPWGLGTGMNTGAARYVLGDPSWEAFESYYAKAAYEFGIVGPFIILTLFATLIFTAIQVASTARSPMIRACAVGLATFYLAFAANSLKGWMVDQDPINVYFWLFTGILFRLPDLDANLAPTVPRASERTAERGFSFLRT